MTLKDLWSKLDVIAVIGFLIAIEQQITTGSMSFTHTLPAPWIEIVKEWAGNLASIGGLLVGILRMSSNPGAPSGPSTIVKILAAAALLSLLLPADPAVAQAKVKLGPVGQQIKNDLDQAKAATTGQPVDTAAQTERQKLGYDLLNLKPGCKTAKVTDDFKDLDSAMSDPMKSFVTFVQGDTKTAIELTTAIDGLPDGNGQACYTQLQKSGAIITKLQDTVKAGGSIGIATVYEVLRLLHMNLVQTCSNKACTQIFTETTNVVAAAAPIATQIPSFTQFCAKIPPIAVEAVTANASTPAPVAVSTSVATPTSAPSPVDATAPK